MLLGILRDARPDLEIAAELAPLLDALVVNARAAWPGVELANEAFLAHLATKLTAPVERSLAALRTDDLYLACAVVHGVDGALGSFEQCLRAIDRSVARIDPEVLDDVRQIVRQLVLVPREGAPPRIADFSGGSKLTNWLRVIAVREAVRLVNRARREVPAEEDEIADALGDDLGPEQRYFRKLYQAEFSAALKESVEALTDRQKTLLRQHVLDGVTVDRLAGLYDIHRATAARWVAAAREELLEGLQAALRRRLQVSPAELESILRLIQSQLHVSLRRML